MGSDGAIPVTPGAISVSGHISNKLHDFYAISNLINFANWSKLVWLSQNLREGTSLFETLPWPFVLFRWETNIWGYSGHH